MISAQLHAKFAGSASVSVRSSISLTGKPGKPRPRLCIRTKRLGLDLSGQLRRANRYLIACGRRSLVLLLSSYNVRSTAARCDIPAAYVEVDTITLLMIFCCRHNLVCFRRVNDGPAGRGCDRRSTRARNLTLLRSFCQDSRPASLRRQSVMLVDAILKSAEAKHITSSPHAYPPLHPGPTICV
jgi:hypothetical protein